MKLLLPLLFSASMAVFAQEKPIEIVATQAPPADPTRTVAVVEGMSFSAEQLERMVAALGGGVQANFSANPKGFIEQFGLLLRLQTLADEEKLSEQEPHKWRLLYNRAVYLAQARMTAQSGRRPISKEEMQKYYDEHVSEFSHAKVRVIYLSVSDKRNEAATEKLADSIAKQVRSGADFATLVKTHSDDADSKAKGGEFPPIKSDDKTLPPAIKAAIFQLKPGQVSDPVRQPAGFWVFRLDEFVAAPFAEVQATVANRLMDKDIQAWLETVRSSVKVELKDPAYFLPRAAAPAPAPAKP